MQTSIDAINMKVESIPLHQGSSTEHVQMNTTSVCNCMLNLQDDQILIEKKEPVSIKVMGTWYIGHPNPYKSLSGCIHTSSLWCTKL